jgi:peptide/nickel transport system ATP-binding protein
VSPLSDDTILEVKDLKMHFPVFKGILRKKMGDVRAVDGVSFGIKRGHTLGLVGESGCGKTTIGHCVLRLYVPTSGEIFFEGQDIVHFRESEMSLLRRRIQLIFQDPYGSLDPRQTAGSIVGEPLRIHRMVGSEREYREKVEELFSMVQLDPAMIDRVPHEFSGGQRQRIGIARALACGPALIVCDEPISALDVSIQAQIINLLQELQEKLGLTYLFIAHDLSVVQHLSNRVAVMHAGRIVEIAEADILCENPVHPYSKALVSAIPTPDPFLEEKRERIVLNGEVPNPTDPPHGCNFHSRCWVASAECHQVVPELHDIGGSHMVACLRI